ncbi:MAG: hypothetical protein VYE73_17635 [Acidobacteriota bacterium]|nr:hypothetical protein [Acidobacteriota bacterium]
MLDTILLEKRGIPGAVVITKPFVPTAKAVARMQQMSDFPFIIVPHPVTSLSVGEAEALADRITDQVETALLQDTSAPEASCEGTRSEAPAQAVDAATLERLVDRLAAGIRADGGELTASAPSQGRLELELSIPDEACAECILPKPHLEAVFTSIVAEQLGPGWVMELRDPRVDA